MMHGRGSLWSTFSSYLQVSSTLFLVSSFAAFVWGACVKSPLIGQTICARIAALSMFVEEPIWFFFVSQLLLQIVYLPLAMTLVHSFTRRKTMFDYLVIGLFAPLGTCLIVLIYLVSGFLLK
jgi:heme exporter protein D